jgi:hypothetical protein
MRLAGGEESGVAPDSGFSVWIDQAGEVHNEERDCLADAIEVSPVGHLVELAVELLGFATVARAGGGEAVVRCSSLSTPWTIEGLVGYLKGVPLTAVALWLCDANRRWAGPMTFPSAAMAAAYLKRWAAARSRRDAMEPIQLKPVEYLVDGELVAQNRAIVFWRSLGGKMPLRLEAALRLARLDRDSAVIVPERGRWVFAEVGDLFWFYSRLWRESAIGRAVEDQPDPGFGAWMRERLGDAVAAKAPLWFAGDALVRVPRHAAVQVSDELVFTPYQDGARRAVVVTVVRARLVAAVDG